MNEHTGNQLAYDVFIQCKAEIIEIPYNFVSVEYSHLMRHRQHTNYALVQCMV